MRTDRNNVGGWIGTRTHGKAHRGMVAMLLAWMVVQLALGALATEGHAQDPGRAARLDLVGALPPTENYDRGQYVGLFPVLLQNNGDANATGSLDVTGLPQGWDWALVEGTGILSNVEVEEVVRVTVQLEARDPMAGIYPFTVHVTPGPVSTELEAHVPFEAGLETVAPTNVQGRPGEKVLLPVSVTNRANGQEVATLQVIQLNADWDHGVLPQATSVPLDPGRGHTWTVELAVPRSAIASIQDGYGYQVLLKVQSSKDPDIYTLNVTQVSVGQLHSLGMTLLDEMAKLNALGNAEVGLMVENLGNGQQEAEVSVTAPSGWSHQVIERAFTLFPSERRPVTVYVSPSKGSISGPQPLTITVAGPGCQPVSVTAQVIVPQRNGILLEHNGTLGPAPPGSSLRFEFDVSNTGNHLDLLEMLPGELPDTWHMTLSPSVISLPPGTTHTVAATLVIGPDPMTALAGKHTVQVKAVSLFNGKGTSVPVRIDISEDPSLTMSVDPPFRTMNPLTDPSPVHIVRMTNDGNSRVTTEIAIDGPEAWAQGSRGSVSLEPGEVCFMHVTVTPPVDASPGTYTIKVSTTLASTRLDIFVVETDVAVTDIQVRSKGDPDWAKDGSMTVGEEVEVVAWLFDKGSDRADVVDVALVVDGRTVQVRKDQPLDIGPTGVMFQTSLPEGWHNISVEVSAPGDVWSDDNKASIMVMMEPGPVTVTPGTALAGATLTTMLFVAGGVMVHEGWKFKAIMLVAVPLYTRIRKETALDNFTRGRIYGYIEANPGEHYNSIKKALEIPNGSLAYHLRTLEREGFIKALMDGTYKRFYPKRMNLPKGDDGQVVPENLSKMQKLIIDSIEREPGISQREIARALNLAPSTINYHVRMLAVAGVLRVERGLGRSRYFLEDPDGPDDIDGDGPA